ncbi:hypothetical protein GC176_12310 [bacterium]|nr:hypothetical protein [bacterium]
MSVISERPRMRFYAGPSIRWNEIEELCSGLDAVVEIAPPIEQGDLLRDLSRLPDVIGIIDGYFYQVPSVLHKEILLALEAGSRVLGAASLGALRAAELDVFGMEGVGRIYEWFADGSIDGDDEVAVQHGPGEIGFRPLTVPLVNVRHAIQLATAHSLISRDDGRSILSAAQDIHFSRRTWGRLFDHDRLRAIDGGVPFREFIAQRAPDLKHEDARTLVETVVKRVRHRREWPDRLDCRVKSSKYTYLMRHQYAGSWSGSRHLPDSQVVSFQKVLDPSFPDIVECVVRRIVACDEAAHRGLVAESPEVLERKFREETNRLDNSHFRDWLNCQGLSRDELVAWLRACDLERQIEAAVSVSESRGPHAVILQAVAARRGLAETDLPALTLSRQTIAFDLPLIRELKCTGRFSEARHVAAGILDSVDAAFAGNHRLRAIMEALGDLVRTSFDEWAAALWGIPTEALPAELVRRAIHSGAEFIDIVRLCKLHQEHGSGCSDSSPVATVDGSGI